MRVAALWRYPVKSLGGERLTTADLRADGIPGDRLVHVRNVDGRVVTARRMPRLLTLAGTLGDDGEPAIDGHPWSSDAALAAVREAAGAPVTLERFRGDDRGQRFDVLPLTVLTDGMVEAVGFTYRRFRPNLFISGVPGLAEREWVDHALHVGDAVIGVRKARQRCVMTTFDPDTAERNPAVLRRVAQEFDGKVALDCWVLQPGAISVGDPVEVRPLPSEVDLPAGNAALHPGGAPAITPAR
jgi:uncharacterized protein